MATYRLDARSQPALRRWRGVVRFFAWLTVYGAGTLIAWYAVAPLHVALLLPSDTEVTHAVQYEPFHLLRTLIASLTDIHFNAYSLLFAPSFIAALCALFSLGGSPSRRVIQALLGLLIATYNLFTCLSLVWEFFWNEAAAGVIEPASYLALSASLIAVVVTFGAFVMALAGAWRWPLLNARSARAVTRWWVAVIAAGAVALGASYFTAWGSWRSSVVPASGEKIIPIGLYFSGASAGQISMLLLLFAPPVIAALSAFLALGAPRWRRVTLSLLGLLAAMFSLVVNLMLFGLLFLRASGYGALARGGVVGLGASIVIVIAMFGLLSIPYPARRRAPTTRLLAEPWPLEAA